MWQVEIKHDGLNKYRVIRGNDRYIVEQKAAIQKAVWDEMYHKKIDKENRVQNKQSKVDEARENSRGSRNS